MTNVSSSIELSARRACPIRLALSLPHVVSAGVVSMLGSHPDRVLLLPRPTEQRAHVELFDPVGHAGDARRALRTGVPLVALTRDRSLESTARARELGAVRVLDLSVGVSELVHTLEQVRRGALRARDPGTEECVFGEDLLTPRETQVVAGICRGLSNVEIAAELYLSVNSVKTYIRSAYRKMGVTRRAQAVRWGLERGF